MIFFLEDNGGMVEHFGIHASCRISTCSKSVGRGPLMCANLWGPSRISGARYLCEIGLPSSLA